MIARSKGNWLAAFCAAFCLLTAFAAGAESPDYGNSISTAATVSVNTSVAGTIGYAGDWDYFRILVPSSGTLTVYTTGGTDTYGYLKNSSGTDLAFNDDSSDVNFRISRTVTAGTYYVAVRHYSSTGTGSYTFVNQFSGSTVTTDDHGNSISTATAVSINTSRAGVINSAGDYDYFRISVPSSGTLTVYTTGSTDTYGYLKNSSGSDLASNDDYNGSTNFRISQTVTAGTYYVAVRHFSSSGTGSYTLVNQFSGSTVTTDDHGNSISTATAVSINTSRAGVINSAGDYDYFRISVPSSGTLTVYTTGGTDTYGYLKNSSGTDLAFNDDSSDVNFRISRTVTAGTYYVAVRHYSSTGTGSYTFVNQFSGSTVTDDHGNSISTATVVSINTSRAGVINYAGDYDYFRISVPSSGTLTVYTTGSTDTYGYLKNSSGSDLASNDDYNGSTNFRISQTVTAGTYYVAVRHFSSTGTGSYTLRVDSLSNNITYGYPHQGGYSITQGNNTGSHTGIGAYAYDFGMPVGTNVVASAGGVVSRIKQDSTLSGCSSTYANDGNYVVIDHGNGKSTLYLHLQANSVTVSVGSSVSKGQVIGRVGLSGYICGAHLHFQLQQTCNSWWCQSVPVTFQ